MFNFVRDGFFCADLGFGSLFQENIFVFCLFCVQDDRGIPKVIRNTNRKGNLTAVDAN